VTAWKLHPPPSKTGKSIQYVMVPAGRTFRSYPENAPETKSFALSIVDPHPVAQRAHWFVINIPASTASLLEGASRKSMAGAVS
jgi:phosphatidylethanolamine-binding protein (PEBP) family uncharacterized protein